MVALLYLFAIVAGLFFKTSSNYKWRVTGLLCLLLLFNDTNSDYWAYSSAYYSLEESAIYNSFEIGWRALCWVGSVLGLSYNAFITIVVLVCLSIFNMRIGAITKNDGLPLALFLIYPGLICLVQIRQFIAMIILLIGIIELVKQSKIGILRFAVCLVIASSIHMTCILFAILVPIVLLMERPSLIWGTIAVLSVVSLVLYPVLPELIMLLTDSDKVEIYLSGYTGYASMPARLATLTVLLGTFLTSFWAYRSKALVAGDEDFCVKTFLFCCMVSNALFLCGAPFLVINTTFMRLQRIPIIMTFISLASVLSPRPLHANDYLLRLALAVSVLLPSMIYVVIPSFGDVVASLLFL